MIRGQLWELTDDASLRKIGDAAFHLLTRHGAHVRHDGVLAQLAAAGCTVHRSAQHVVFAEGLLHQALERFGCGESPEVRIPQGWTPAQHLTTGGSYPHFLDWPACRRRLATIQDVIDNAKMAHVLPEYRTVGKTFTCHEVDQRIEPIWNAATLMSLTDKPLGGGEVLYAQNVKHLVRLGEISSGRAGDTRLVASCDFCISPLIFGRRMVECMIEKSRFGVPHYAGSMPVSGLTGPVTVAGTAALALAELMAGWAIYYLINPDLPASAIVSSGSLDMRTLRASFGSPEAILQDLTVVQAARRLFGVRVWAAYSYVDCRTPGLQAAFEKMLPLLVFPFEGHAPFATNGLLSAGQDYSPVQQLLELDMLGAVARLIGTYEVSDETLAMDVFDEVLGGRVASFLETDHTLRHFRAHQWYPRWLNRQIWQGDEAERNRDGQVMAAIDAYWKDAVRRYEPPELDRSKLAEAQAVLRAAEAEMPSLEAGV